MAALAIAMVCSGSIAQAEPDDDQPDACYGVVRGRAVDASTGEPVPGARVKADDRETYTSQDGSFELAGVCGRAVEVSFERADYQRRAKRVRVIDGEAKLEVALDARSVTRLDDVIVEAIAAPRGETRSATTLSNDALDRTRGRDLANSIASIPGVTLLGSGATAKPIIRGQFGRRLLILVDGVRHENQKWGLDHAPEIDPFSAGSITVVKGAAGVRYGPDAIGGVILVEPPPMPAAPGVHGELFAIGATNGGKGTLAGRIDGALQSVPGLSWRLAANVSRGAAPSTPDYPLDNTGIFEWNASANAAYSTDRFDLQLSYRRFDVKNGLCSCIRNGSPGDFFDQIERGEPIDVDAYRSDYEIERAFQDVSHDTLLARARIDIGAAGTVAATYSYQLNDRKEFDVVRNSITGPQADFDLRTHALDLSFDHAERDLLGATLSGTAGLALNRQEQIYRGLPLLPNYRNFTGGVFATEQLAFDSFQAAAGVRYDRSQRTSFLDDKLYERHERRGTLDADDCTVSPQSARCKLDFDGVSASVGGVWLARADTNLKLDLSVAQRFPFVDEQYINGSAPTFPVVGIGQPDLGTETTWNGSLTGLFQNKFLFGELSLFASVVDDYIYFAPDVLPDGSLGFEVTIRGAFPRFVNRAVDATFYGADGGFRVQTPWSVDVEGQFSIVRGVNRTDDGFLVFVPPNRFGASATYRLPEFAGWRAGFASLSTTVVARQGRFDPNADFAPPPDGYVLFGASAGAEKNLGDTTLAVSVEANNVLNQRYREYTSLLRYYADQPGFDLLLRTQLSF